MKRFSIGLAVGATLATAGTAGAIAVSDYVIGRDDTARLSGTNVFCTHERVQRTDAFACFVIAGSEGKPRTYNALISEKGVVVSRFDRKGNSKPVKAYNNP
jgi:hypothetical protein